MGYEISYWSDIGGRGKVAARAMWTLIPFRSHDYDPGAMIVLDAM